MGYSFSAGSMRNLSWYSFMMQILFAAVVDLDFDSVALLIKMKVESSAIAIAAGFKYVYY